MKNSFSILFLFVSINLFSQTISQTAISSGSNSFSDKKMNYSYTIGGVFSGTISNGNSFTQGFQQPEFVAKTKEVAKNEFKVQVFPNPVIDYLNIRFFAKQESQITIKVYDIAGKIVQTQIFETFENEPSKTIKINLSNLQQGNYIVSILNATKGVVCLHSK